MSQASGVGRAGWVTSSDVPEEWTPIRIGPVPVASAISTYSRRQKDLRLLATRPVAEAAAAKGCACKTYKEDERMVLCGLTANARTIVAR